MNDAARCVGYAGRRQSRARLHDRHAAGRTPRHSPNYSFTAEDLVATLDKHGVPMAVIAAASPWGDYNDYTIATLRKYPRLRGTVILKPTVERMCSTR